MIVLMTEGLVKSWIWATVGTRFGPLPWTARTAIV
jgi:hypothetical protein